MRALSTGVQVTGEERKYARAEQEPSDHVACTVEMANFNQTYEVAVIDEIQMVKDFQRGWAWTRALLGIPAQEIHVCGEVRGRGTTKLYTLAVVQGLLRPFQERILPWIYLSHARFPCPFSYVSSSRPSMIFHRQSI